MKKYLKILLVLLMFVALPVFAVSDELFVAEDSVNVDENKNGSSFIAGNTVDVDSNVDGILFAAGNNVTVNGQSDYAFIAGNVVKVEEQKFRDGFIAASSIELRKVEVERDVYAAASTITLEGTVGRNAYLAASTVIVKGKVSGNATIYAENIKIEDGAVINGTLKYSEDSTITISDSAIIGNKKVTKDKLSLSAPKNVSIVSNITSKLLSLANTLVVGLLLMLLFPALFEKIAEGDKNTILSKLGFGFLTLIVAPIAALIIMMTVVGVGAGFLLLDFYVVAICLSTIFTSYFLSNLLLKDKINNKYALLVIGVAAITLLKLVPFIGIIVSICSLCIGLGTLVTLVFNRK